MKLKFSVLLILVGMVALVVFAAMKATATTTRSAAEWQNEAWMRPDPTLPRNLPQRILSLTDLPSLKNPTPANFLLASQKSRKAGCNGAVLTFSWPKLEPSEGKFTLEDLKGAVALNEGRTLFLGIQVLNTTVKDLPADLQKKKTR